MKLKKYDLVVSKRAIDGKKPKGVGIVTSFESGCFGEQVARVYFPDWNDGHDGYNLLSREIMVTGTSMKMIMTRWRRPES